jgi:hypothetical protein
MMMMVMPMISRAGWFIQSRRHCPSCAQNFTANFTALNAETAPNRTFGSS